ncbi:MAG TPA: phosphoribosyltransferase family protein, partial [Verrucomicrobiae bacterium]|nr:phosphoribosyltransferase family protein [Verrucomicrobiae bacterium]
LREYRSLFHGSDLPVLRDKGILLVDDGLATGATAEAAVRSARRQGACRVTMATPVASTSAVERLRRVADEVVTLLVDAGFEAVCQYYDEFSQTTDEEVLELLHAAALRRD